MTQQQPEKENQEQQQQQEKESQQQQQCCNNSNDSSNKTNINSNNIVVNETRVRDSDGFVGTIVYLGNVASAKNSTEIYAGIKWDDHTRGKHDGSVICRKTKQIIRHFTCDYPTQGSFMRINNKLDFGLTLNPKLLYEKYVQMDSPLIAPNNLLQHTATTSKGYSKPIEFLGELQIRKKQQLDNVDKISLRNSGISKAYNNNNNNNYDQDDNDNDDDSTNNNNNNKKERKKTNLSLGFTEFNNIRHIDLAGNLFSNWIEVIKVINQFPNLEDFSIAYNRIRDIDINNIQPNIIYKNLKILNLNHCSIEKLDTIKWIGKCMPNLEQLCISSSYCFDIDIIDTVGTAAATTTSTIDNNGDNNGINTISSSVVDNNRNKNKQSYSYSYNYYSITFQGLFQNLITLDCSNCNISSWDNQIVPLFKDLPNLQHLCLDDNPISSIINNTNSERENNNNNINENGDNGESHHHGSSSSSSSSLSSSSSYFNNLQSIQLSGTLISNWMDIEVGLNSLTKLKSLKLKNTPLTSQMSQSETRFLAIARFPNLEYFNSSTIRNSEKNEAEKRYVTYVTKLLLLQKATKQQQNQVHVQQVDEQTRAQAQGSSNDIVDDVKEDGSTTTSEQQQQQKQDDDDIKQQQQILAEHPQYIKLKEKYKNLISAQHQQHQNQQGGIIGAAGGGGNNISSTILNVTIRSMVPSSCSMEPLVKRLPGTLTVGRLKALCCRSFGFVQDIDLMSLHFRNNKNDPFPMELDNDDNNLNYYGVCDGAEILINEIDLSTKLQEEKLLREQHEQQILKEERAIKMKMDEMKKMKQ